MTAQRSAEGSGVLEKLLDRRSDPQCRLVLADFLYERGEDPGRLGVLLWIADAADADDDDADAAAADADAAAADADDDDADADAAADDDADAADADADAAAAAANRRHLHQLLTETPDMKNGLKIVQLPGRYGYSVTRVGWLRRVQGDEWELVNGRTIMRTRGNYALAGINKLASGGPHRDYAISEQDELPEEIHRLVIRRSLPANEKAWAADCPRPTNWLSDNDQR